MTNVSVYSTFAVVLCDVEMKQLVSYKKQTVQMLAMVINLGPCDA